MSARAAARLESLGFGNVMRYTAGKADWAANGLPTEGALTRMVRASVVTRADVLMCAPDERLVDVQKRARDSNSEIAVVVSRDRVVLGALDQQILNRASDARVDDVMTRGPITVRPNLTVHAAEDYLRQNDLDAVLVTTSDGKLIGVLRRADVADAARAA